MSYYSVEHINHRLTTVYDMNGNATRQDDYQSKKTTCNLANKQGTRPMKMYDYAEMQEQTIKSTQDLQIWNLLVNSHKDDGSLKSKKGAHINVSGLAKHFECSRQNIGNFIRRAKAANFIQVRTRVLYINPFVSIPFHIDDAHLHAIQKEWKSNAI